MFKMIMWATDSSSGAAQALPFAKGLAQADGARLIVVHVDEHVFGVGRGDGYSVNVDETEVKAAIQKQVDDLKREGFDVVLQASRVWMGGAAHVIADIAKEQGADLIVAGTRGLGPVSGLGSVTHRLVQIAPCPVLVVPST